MYHTARNLLASVSLFVLIASGRNVLVAAPGQFASSSSSPAFTFSPSNPVIGTTVRFDGSASTCAASPCAYRWTDDADGSLLGRGIRMSFVFRDVATKYVRLTITDARRQRTSIEHDVVVTQGVSASVPAFNFSPLNPTTTSPVSFDGSLSKCAASPCAFRWTNDTDGVSMGIGMKIAFKFQRGGAKRIRLTITDAQSRDASVNQTVTVAESSVPPVVLAPPVPAFAYSPANPVTGSAISFDGSSSTCAASPCSFSWTDDTDGSLLATGISTSFTFQQGGTKKVRLTITDAQTRSASVEHDVIISQASLPPAPAPIAAPVPAFTYSPSNPVTGSAVSFDGSSSTCAASPCSIRWTDDVDGSLLATGITMSFTFQQVGTKKVRLTMTDAQSRSASVEHDVIVSAAPASSAPPVAAFTYNPANPVTGSAVSFDGSGSTCTASPCSYRWTDDADSSQLGTGITISLTFQQAGTKRIRLTVTDAQSRAASIERDVIVSSTSNPPPVAGAYYVAPSGNDSNAGTSASPWRTIQKAANTLNAGDTVIVTAGTYNERVRITRSGSSGNVMTFQAQGTVVMQGFNVQANYSKVDGFEIVSSGSGFSDYGNGSGVYLSGSSNTISNNYIHNSTAAGIFVSSSASNSTISNNRIAYAVECGISINGTNNLIVSNEISHSRDVNGSDADGIRFFGSGNTVRKNYIHDIILSDSPGQSPHIDCYQTWGPATNYVFEQNLCDKSGDGPKQGFTIENYGGQFSVSNIIIRNNVFVTRGSGGYNPDVNVGDLGLVTNVTIANNTMVAVNGAVEYAIWLFTNLRGAVVKNNAIHNHGNRSTPYIQVESGASGLDIGFNSVSKSDGVAPQGSPYAGDLWMVNPLFANQTNLDFHLQSTSPLIDRGINLSGLTDSYDGTSRPQGLLDDIGAFEYHLP